MIKRRRSSLSIPASQIVLLLPDIKQPYSICHGHPVPQISAHDEVLIRVETIGLNPIDWKAPDLGFGIPQLPYLSGRELVGTVIDSSVPSKTSKVGQRVIAISTDYRDQRKSAYQQYAVAKLSNIVPLPSNVGADEGAAVGVAFVTSVLCLGVCTGIDFDGILSGPKLHSILTSVGPDRLPEDVRNECLSGITLTERPGIGDWVAIWGGSATCALMLNQLARLAGLRTILILDVEKHADLLQTHPGYQSNAVVDDRDPERAVDIVCSITRGKLRFGVDVVGRPTSEMLLKCLQPQARLKRLSGSKDPQRLTPPATPPSEVDTAASHLVGLSGLPKHNTAGIVYHAVPVKLFHEVEEVGEAIVSWLHRLLENGKLKPPRILGPVQGFQNINGGLDRMRAREISGGRLVARISE